MSVDIEKICRTCLALSGPLLSIYDGGTYGDTIAHMLRDFTKMKPSPSDNMPQKVCLTCISEINRCFSFKIKCENANRTLRQLLPNAVEEEEEASSLIIKDCNVVMTTRSVQTTPEREIGKRAVHVQTIPTVVDNADNLILEDGSTNILPEDEIPRKTRKRAAIRAAITNAKQSFKRKITENYNIGCDEDGYEFILKVDNQQREIDMETTKARNNTEAYELRGDGNFECEEYAFEAVIEDEDDQTVQSDDVVFVKAESIGIHESSSQKSFVIVKSIDGVKSGTENKSTKITSRRDFGCTKCVMSFCSLKVLRRHMNKLHGLNIDEGALNDMKYRVLEQNEANVPEDCETQENCTERSLAEDNNFKDNATYSKKDSNNASIHKFVCSKCESSFTSLRSLNYHMKKNICNAQSYECDQCERVFTSADKLESHATSHRTAAIECPECGKTFMTTEELSNHQINVHKRSARNQCNICKKVFTMLSTLRDHLRTHSGEKPFLCTICGKAFSQNANLKQHIQRHDKDKKFKCDECSNSYVTKAELFSHKRSHNGDHPYKCEDCSATFTTSSSLVKHRRRHTGERPYACDICPMRFAVLNVLKNHRRLHTGEKPYQCPHCDKKFTQKGDCMIHASKHVENNTYDCNSCEKSFPHVALLRQHYKRSHTKSYNEGSDSKDED